MQAWELAADIAIAIDNGECVEDLPEFDRTDQM
jgi:hypothetical protein